MKGLITLLLLGFISSPSNLLDSPLPEEQSSINSILLAVKLTTKKPPKPAISLPIMTVTSQNIPRYYSATGYTSIAQQVELSTSQAGIIKKLIAKEGDIVKAGGLLIVIDESELRAAIKQAKSAIHSATINLKDRQRDFNTSQKLAHSRVIPTEQFRKARVQLELARSQLTQAKNGLERQQSRKPYYRITSPFRARVIKRWVSQGDLAVSGKPLLQLEALQGVEFETALPTQWLHKVRRGNRYQLRLHDSKNTITATVSNIIHSANRVTQTCLIKLSLPQGNKLTAGLSGQIKFVIGNEKHLIIPESSLIKKAGVQGVFRVDKQHKAIFSPVKIERIWQQKRVVLSGLKKGDQVVINPLSSLRDGTLIKTRKVVAK